MINKIRSELPSYNQMKPDDINTAKSEQRELCVIHMFGFPCLYKGECLIGTNTPHGKGFQIGAEGNIFEGFCKNGEWHGVTRIIKVEAGKPKIKIFYYQDGKLRYRLEYDALYDGQWEEGAQIDGCFALKR